MNNPLPLGSRDRTLQSLKSVLLIFILSCLMPSVAFSQVGTNVCGTDIDVHVGTPGVPKQLNEPIPIRVDIIAQDIDHEHFDGDANLDIFELFELTFGPDCADDEDLTDCASPGNVVEFNYGVTTTCETIGNAALNIDVDPLATAQNNTYIFTPDAGPIGLEGNQAPFDACSISFSITVKSLDPLNTSGTIFQAAGWDTADG